MAKFFGIAGSSIDLGVVYKDALYFAALSQGFGKELWQLTATGVTATGATMMVDYVPGGGSSLPTSFRVVGDRLFFSATDGSTGLELYELASTTKISETGSVSSFRVVPNPATNGRFLAEGVLEKPMSICVEVLACNGQLLRQQVCRLLPPGTFSLPVNLHDLPAGQYLISVRRSDGRVLATERLVKQ